MPLTDLETDVLVIGGGGAGCIAAITAHDLGRRVTLVTKGPFGQDGAATWMAGYGFQAAFPPEDSLERHLLDTLKVGEYLNHQDLLAALIETAPKIWANLRRWGVHYEVKGDRPVMRRLPGQSVPRTPVLARPGAIAGLDYRRVLTRQIRRRGIQVLDDFLAMDLMGDGASVSGLLGLDLRTGDFRLVRAKATILATGGFMGGYRATSTSPTLTGDGYALAYRAGAELMDMEFTDFYPVVGWPPRYRGELDWVTNLRYELPGVILNRLGQEFLSSYRGQPGSIPGAMAREIRAGRGTDHGGVYLSFKHLPDNLLAEYLRSLGSSKMARRALSPDFDLTRNAVEMIPAPLESLGGCRIDSSCATNLQGLFAAGEVAGGAEGACTISGNPITLYMSMGVIAGESAARWADRNGLAPVDLKQAEKVISAALAPLESPGGELPAMSLLDQVRGLVEDHCHLLGRTNERLKEGLDKALELQEKIKALGIRIQYRGRIFNQELAASLEAQNLLQVAEMVMRASLSRPESRGVFLREDYLQRSPEWMCHLGIREANGTMELFTFPVEFTIKAPDPNPTAVRSDNHGKG